MQKFTVLNTREIQQIKELLVGQFGCALPGEYVYLKSEKDKIMIIAKDLARINFSDLKIDKIGLYFGEMKKNQIRLSKEGAQILAREAGRKKLKNVVELNQEEVKEYFSGKDLEFNLGPENRLVLLQYRQEIMGCAQYKEGKILNFLPKLYRGKVIV